MFKLRFRMKNLHVLGYPNPTKRYSKIAIAFNTASRKMQSYNGTASFRRKFAFCSSTEIIVCCLCLVSAAAQAFSLAVSQPRQPERYAAHIPYPGGGGGPASCGSGRQSVNSIDSTNRFATYLGCPHL